MAINLKKENYSDDNERYNGASDDGEIYPQREVFPAQNNSAETQYDRDPQPQMNIQTAEETAVRVPNYNTAPATNAHPPKKRLGAGPLMLIIGGVLTMCVFVIVAVAGMAHEVRSMADPEIAVTEHIYQEPDTDFVYSGENVGDITLNGDYINLDVQFGSGTDITFTTISGKSISFTEEMGLSDESSTLTADYISDEYHDEDDYYKEDIILTLPKGFDGQLRLTGRNSDISCTSEGLGSMIDFSCADGSIYLSQVSAVDINLNSDNGTISAYTVTADSFAAHTDNGSMFLSEVNVDGVSDISTGNGHMDLENMHFGGETVIVSNGDIDGATLNFIGDSSITCSNSEIALIDTEFRNMTVSNGNGNTFIDTPCSRDDYTVSASTSNGECYVENGGNGKYKLEVRNHNGDVEVTFGDFTESEQ